MPPNPPNIEKGFRDGDLPLAPASKVLQQPHIVNNVAKKHPTADNLNREVVVVNGRGAVSLAAYALSDVNFVYPSSPSNYLGEEINGWVRSERTNVFKEVPKAVRLQVKPGAGSAVIGCLSTGELSTIFIGSEGLSMFYPTLHRLSNDHLPGVLHVETRSLSNELVIGLDHTAIYGARQSGTVILSSHNAQESHDLAVISHLSAMRCSLPIIHFFDSPNTAATISKLSLLSSDQLATLTAKISPVNQSRHASPTQQPNAYPAYQDIPDIVDSVMREAEDWLGIRYRPFEYIGASDAHHVVVVMGEISNSFEAFVKSANRRKEKIGVVKVRLYRPWSLEYFLQVVPFSVRSLCVVECTNSNTTGMDPTPAGALYADVLDTVLNSDWSTPHPIVVVRGRVIGRRISPSMTSAVFANLAQSIPRNGFTLGSTSELTELTTSQEVSIDDDDSNQERDNCRVTYSIWDVDQSGLAQYMSQTLRNISAQSNLSIQTNQEYDCYFHGGVINTHLTLSNQLQPLMDPYHYTTTNLVDAVIINSDTLLDKYDFISTIRPGASIVINTSWDPEELEGRLPVTFKRGVVANQLKVYYINAKKVAGELDNTPINYVLVSTLFALANEIQDQNQDSSLANEYLHGLSVVYSSNESELKKCVEALASTSVGIQGMGVPERWTSIEEGEGEGEGEKEKEKKEEEKEKKEPLILPSYVTGNLLPETAYAAVVPPTYQFHSNHLAAWHCMFQEEYATENIVRPNEKGCFTVTLTTHKRLTSEEYERNVFHLEMDITGTGLSYSIGDALGVYGHNDALAVMEFIDWYKLNPDDVVTLNRSQTHSNKSETRTLYHWLSQYTDLLGRPSKAFYEQLAAYATENNEKETLLYIVSAEGKMEFKNRVESSITYAEILLEFPSAHPPIENLLEMIPPIKPRHYSIASSMKMHPTSVHLLVVLHDWTTPDGRHRIGQCTRYLADLPVGSKMTVSVKPSVMVLPPLASQPVIMSGLGTGMAPFRAFIQERAYLKSQGETIGPMILYFGSRSRYQEYLYGEEVEAYHSAGVLTELRCAFSRDQRSKVYIQHKMREDKEILNRFLNEQNGYFYLCGPTNPASDVKDAIVFSFMECAGLAKSDANVRLNTIKEEGRYVLEVY